MADVCWNRNYTLTSLSLIVFNINSLKCLTWMGETQNCLELRTGWKMNGCGRLQSAWNETDRCSQKLEFPRPLCQNMQPVPLLSLLYTGCNCVCAFSWRKQSTVATKTSRWKQFYPGRTSEVLISRSFRQELSFFFFFFFLSGVVLIFMLVYKMNTSISDAPQLSKNTVRHRQWK